MQTHHHGVKIIALTDKDRANIAKAAASVAGDPYKDIEGFRKRSAAALQNVLGPDILKDLKDMHDHKGKNVALLIKNLPVSLNGLSDTPKLGTKKSRKVNQILFLKLL